MTSRSVLIVTVALAVSCSEVAAAPPEALPWGYLALGPGLALLAWVLGAWFGRGDDGELAPARVALPLMLVAAALPWALEPLRQMVLHQGRSLELLLIELLRNLLVALAALRAWPLCARLAGLCSLFLVLFASGLTGDPPALPWLMAGYAAAATWWMVLAYWEKACGEQAPRLPWAGLVVVFLVVGAFLAVGLAGPTRAARVLGELVPTSGGTGAYDPNARGGVNDGEEEARGDNAKSAGFLETGRFIEDDRPSLYDVVNEMAGEARRNKEQEHSVSLKPEQVRELRDRPAENLGGRREFSTSRRAPPDARQPSDVDTRALFFVVGRVPLHLRMNAHDEFDGVKWREARHANQPLVVDHGGPGDYWMRMSRPRWPAWLGPEEAHELRFTRLKSYQFPTPPHLVAFRLGRVDRPDFFGVMCPGVLRLRDRTVPAAVSLHTTTRVPCPELLGAVRMSPPGGRAGQPGPRIAALAREWAGDAPYGMPQVRRIEQALRRHAALDWAVSCPDGEKDAVSWFLFESRRGPDYLFASALVVLLRSRGYTARLASGFYAEPSRYDPARDHTPVVPEDLHFWAEVLIGNDGEWVVLEPTPGYEVLSPAPTWWGRLQGWVQAALSWSWLLVPVAAGVGVLWLTRRLFLDVVGRLWWDWLARRCWRAAVLGALWLIERRAAWAGGPRPAHSSPSRWQQGLAGGEGLARLTELAEWAAYAPEGCPPVCPHCEALALCRRCLDEWTVARFRRACQGAA